jgi:hypothetical protein
MRNMCLLGEVLPNFFFLGTNLKILNNKAHQLHSPKHVTSFVRDSNGHKVHFFQCQFLWIYDFVKNLFHVILLLKRYNLFDTIFLILFPVSIFK